MYQLVATIILTGSFLGMLTILRHKIPVLVKLPETEGKSQKTLLFKLKRRVFSVLPKKSFSYEIFLQKLLSKIRILTLKTDRKTSSWLQKLRERSKKKKIIENDNYWQELKKSKKEKE